MSYTLRPYQQRLDAEVTGAWSAGARNVLAVSPTGSGKTVFFAHCVSRERGGSVAIAHRQELVSQISLALAREGLRHRIIGPDSVVRLCTSAHLDELGASYHDPGSRYAAAGVDTLVRLPATDPLFLQTALWVLDEAHHVLAENKWGECAKRFVNARGLGVTATPLRADGKGLGRHADGLFDAMVLGPSMRSLIEQGYLTEYRVFAPPSDLDLSNVAVGATGDYSAKPLKEARQRSHVTGDVVEHYLRIARGKLGVTFDTDVESATQTAEAYRAAGVPAEVVSAKTPDSVRAAILRKFRNREVLQLVNVDLFGEGFDLPAIEVVSMARPTQSYGLFVQQFGRALRPMQGKTHAIVIDHVGNVSRHGLPDAYREWSLDRRERRARSGPTDAIPVRTCLNPECVSVYERVLPACPYCGHAPAPTERSAPEFVDGDLHELSPEALAKLRGDAERLRGDWFAIPNGAGVDTVRSLEKRHVGNQAAQAHLEDAIALWAGWQKHLGRGDAETYRRFYHTFGVDMGTAVTLKARDAEPLTERIRAQLQSNNVVKA